LAGIIIFKLAEASAVKGKAPDANKAAQVFKKASRRIDNSILRGQKAMA
jgi:hypothetical protein